MVEYRRGKVRRARNDWIQKNKRMGRRWKAGYDRGNIVFVLGCWLLERKGWVGKE
jgi:hypothetical protein